MKANLGLQPIVGGGDENSSGGGGAVIRVPVPMLDSDGKKELLKVVSKIGETTKVQIRGHRKDAMQVRSHKSYLECLNTYTCTRTRVCVVDHNETDKIDVLLRVLILHFQAIKKLSSSAPEDDRRTAEKNVQKVIDDSLVVVSNAITLKQKEL